jgi:hypothetical protein
MEDLLTGADPLGRRRPRLAALVLARPDDHVRRFLGADGWITQSMGQPFWVE